MATKTRVSIDEGVNFSQFIAFNGVQSAADAFVQVEISTGVSPNNGFILDVEEVVISLDVVNQPGFSYASMDYCLTRASKVAIPALTDLDVIAKGKIFSFGAGTMVNSSAGMLESPINMTFTGKQIIASPSVYFQFDTNGFAAVNSFSGRIYYKQVPMAKDRILEVLYG